MISEKKEAIDQLINSFEEWEKISKRHYQQEVNKLNIAFDKANKLVHDDKFERAFQQWLKCDEPRKKKEIAKRDFIESFKNWVNKIHD